MVEVLAHEIPPLRSINKPLPLPEEQRSNARIKDANTINIVDHYLCTLYLAVPAERAKIVSG